METYVRHPGVRILPTNTSRNPRSRNVRTTLCLAGIHLLARSDSSRSDREIDVEMEVRRIFPQSFNVDVRSATSSRTMLMGALSKSRVSCYSQYLIRLFASLRLLIGSLRRQGDIPTLQASEGGMIRLETLIGLEISQFEFFELIILSKLDKEFSIEQFEPTVSQSTVPSPPSKLRRLSGKLDPEDLSKKINEFIIVKVIVILSNIDRVTGLMIIVIIIIIISSSINNNKVIYLKDKRTRGERT